MCANHKTIQYQDLIEGNKKFIEKMLQEDAGFFERLSKGQKPPVLWIGCSDSRVPANQITNTQPGEIFVHRNIANVVVNSDMNLLSVLDYSINVLEVRYVIVCGHYGCGGVAAAMGHRQFGLIDNWLRHIKDVYRLYADQLDGIEDEQLRSNRLVELNVTESVYNLSKTSIVQNAWKKGKQLSLHGWAYSLETGRINDLNVSYAGKEEIEEVFRLE